MVTLATSLLEQGHYPEAEKLLQDALASQKRILGSQHLDVGASLYQLAILHAREGQNTEALATLGEAIDQGLLPDIAAGIEANPDLKSLRGNPRFTAIVAEITKRCPTPAPKTN